MLSQNKKDDYWTDLPIDPPAPGLMKKDKLPYTDPTPLHGPAAPIIDPEEALERAKKKPGVSGPTFS